MIRALLTRLARILLALGLVCGAVACGTAAPSAEVTILIPWDKTANPGEYSAFDKIVQPYAHAHGFRLNLEPTRGVSQQLDADLAAHVPPDLADLPGPGAVDQFKSDLRPLRISLGDYAQPWRGLAMLGTSAVYAVPVKADVQSLIWYSTHGVAAPPTTWQALENVSRQPGTPWCLGLASGTVSGWPGTDWIADIFMARYGAAQYERWLNGTLPWDSPQVRYARQEWGTLLRLGQAGTAVSGGPSTALTTQFNQAFAPGKCELEDGALVATGLASTTGYNYARFPSVSGGNSPIVVSGDFMGLFTDNPNARKLLTYLASPKAQALWVRQRSGDAFSANQAVMPKVYTTTVRSGIARLLQANAGNSLCFDALDLMTSDLSAAFDQAVLEYVNNPSSLSGLLRSLEQTQKSAGSSPISKLACPAQS